MIQGWEINVRSRAFGSFCLSISETRNAGAAQLDIIAFGSYCGLFRTGCRGGTKEVVDAGWRQGTAGVPLGAAATEPALWVYSTMWLLILVKGSSHSINSSRGGGNYPQIIHALPASLLQCLPETLSRAQAPWDP